VWFSTAVVSWIFVSDEPLNELDKYEILGKDENKTVRDKENSQKLQRKELITLQHLKCFVYNVYTDVLMGVLVNTNGRLRYRMFKNIVCRTRPKGLRTEKSLALTEALFCTI
jgi:hypothetical protein